MNEREGKRDLVNIALQHILKKENWLLSFSTQEPDYHWELESSYPADRTKVYVTYKSLVYNINFNVENTKDKKSLHDLQRCRRIPQFNPHILYVHVYCLNIEEMHFKIHFKFEVFVYLKLDVLHNMKS